MSTLKDSIIESAKIRAQEFVARAETESVELGADGGLAAHEAWKDACWQEDAAKITGVSSGEWYRRRVAHALYHDTLDSEIDRLS